MVATGRQRSHRPTITPNKTCSANLYRRIKRRVGRSLKQTHCQRDLVTARKQTAVAVAVDALSLQWEGLDAYAFPPAAILGKVVEKLQDSPCMRIIVCVWETFRLRRLRILFSL